MSRISVLATGAQTTQNARNSSRVSSAEEKKIGNMTVKLKWSKSVVVDEILIRNELSR